MVRVTERLIVPDDELEVTFARSGGAGGQNVNKVSSKAQLRFLFRTSASLPEDVRRRFEARYRARLTNDGSLLLSCDRHRDQKQNLDECKERLRRMILDVLTPPKRRVATKPTRGSKERRLKEKTRRGQVKAARRGALDD